MNCTLTHPLMSTQRSYGRRVVGKWFWVCVGLSAMLHLLLVLAVTGWMTRSPKLEKPEEPGLAVEFRIDALPTSDSEPVSRQEPQSQAVEKERPVEETLPTEVSKVKKPARSKHAEADGRAGHPNATARGEARPSPQGNPRPEYPDFAKRKGWQGECLLRVVVTAEGRADSVAVHRSSGFAILDQSAVAAVRRWRFLPSVDGGGSRVSTIEVPVNFSLLER